MKRVIVRTPETDRKLITIPTSLADLSDTPTGKAYYVGDGNAAIPNGFDVDVPCPSSSDLVEMSADGTGLVISTAALYLVTFSISWANGPLIGPMVGWQAPTPANRRVSLYVNGAYVAAAQTSSVVVGTDAGSIIIRLAAGDTVRVHATNNDPAPPPNTGIYDAAQVTAVAVAP